MGLPRGLLTFVSPLCARIGNSVLSTPITSPIPTIFLPGRATGTATVHVPTGKHDKFAVNLTRTQPIATAQQQKVSD
jgi:hypothetical protein